MSSAVASAIRPSLRDHRQPSSPHTPNRFISSNYSSPGSTFRHEEDAVIFELNPRSISAGLEGESGAQCCIAFSPEKWRRVGDYRVHMTDYKRREGKIETWSNDYELWRNDIRDVDLGLLEDRLERVVREIYNKHLLADAGSTRLVLVLPSIVPHPILSTILRLFFERWRYPTITLLPAPTMVAVAAGMRTALVVDIGWEETVITPVYEYREIKSRSTTRGMKMLNEKVGRFLHKVREDENERGNAGLRFDFETTEDFTYRLARCSERTEATIREADRPDTQKPTTDSQSRDVEVDWPTDMSSRCVSISTQAFTNNVETTFFAEEDLYPNDHELLVPHLMFDTLAGLPADARAACMARITFAGEGAKIPGLSSRLMAELDVLVRNRGFDRPYCKRTTVRANGPTEIIDRWSGLSDARHSEHIPSGKDYVEERLLKQKLKDGQTPLQGTLRQVEGLGVWEGASLATSLKIRGFVEIERERFLSHGLSGASKEVEISVVPQRMSSYVGSIKTGERTSWTLAGWG